MRLFMQIAGYLQIYVASTAPTDTAWIAPAPYCCYADLASYDPSWQPSWTVAPSQKFSSSPTTSPFPLDINERQRPAPSSGRVNSIVARLLDSMRLFMQIAGYLQIYVASTAPTDTAWIAPAPYCCYADLASYDPSWQPSWTVAPSQKLSSSPTTSPFPLDINERQRPAPSSGRVNSIVARLLDSMRLFMQGRIAYVPQLAHVHNMTVRDNILYGKPMDDDFYDEVIACCKLTDDLNRLPGGDLTEVGEKGGNLSGGQKQRISLARAVYSRSDVYLLDDPLSALDSIVGNSIFQAVIGHTGMLGNKTRIMVCNQGGYLRHMDKLVLVHDRGVRVYSCVEDLLADQDSPETLREGARAEAVHCAQEDGAQAKEGQENESAGRVIQKEQQGSDKSAFSILCALVRLSGWPAMVASGAFVLSATALTLQQLWIKLWTDVSSDGEANVDAHRDSWIKVLVGFCAFD
ncbi:hypothetical protein V5799_013167, partial [Amblyomma americanum]